MAYWKSEPSWEQDRSIVGSVEKTESTTSVNITSNHVGRNYKGDKLAKAGLFLAKVKGVNRFLPRDIVGTGGIVTDSPNVPVSMPEVFLPGDTLYSLEPKATITLGGTFAPADTVTINLGNRSFTTPVGSATLATVVTNVVAALNMSGISDAYRAEATSGTVLTLFSKGDIPNITVSKTGDGTIAASTQFEAGPVLVGTIGSMNSEDSTIVLTGDAAVAVSAGGCIGTLFEEVYGIHLHSVDFTDRPSVDLNAVHGASRVYRQALPYVDKALEAMFPKLIIN